MTRLGMRPARRTWITLGSALLLVLLGLAAPPINATSALAETAGNCIPPSSLPAGLAPAVQALFPHASQPAVTWSQQAQITAADGAAGGNVGVSVAISGTTAVIGAYHEIGNGVNTGAAYVFMRGAGGWTQQAKLVAADGLYGDCFGASVALSGDTAVIGAPDKLVDGATGAGAAYVFVRRGTSWTQQAELSAANSQYDTFFGSAVALSGDTVVVGAPGKTVNSVGGAGAAYVFVHGAGGWTQRAELAASVANGTSTGFGTSVGLSGNTAVVGAPGASNVTGAAYVFVGRNGRWMQQARLSAAIAPGDDFGSAVALSGSTAVVGAFAKNNSTGTAYVFVRDAGGWAQQAQLTAADGAPNDQFGFSLALSGNTAVVGAWNTTNNAGAAYVFGRSGTSWMQQAELSAADGAPNGQFGFAVALSGGTAVVGAPNDDIVGAAYVFARSGATVPAEATTT